MYQVGVSQPYNNNLFAPGHTACAGCGQSLAARLVLNALGPNVIVANATGCLEVFSSNFPQSSWEVPWIHSLFENTPAVASGIEAALKALGREDEAIVVAQGGDGGFADIGFGALSGAIERGHNILFIVYDNEAYMNTGVQRSGLTPFDASTTTSPAGGCSFGNPTDKKPVAQIVAAHGAPYVAVTSVGYYRDLERKVQKAAGIKGPKFLQIHVPCPLGWGHDTSLTIKIARLAVQTGLYPLFEMENGEITSVVKITPKPRPVEDYLKPQARFRHLFKPGAEEELKKIQAIADENIRRYKLYEG